MMAVLENGKHELFAQKWHETDNKSEAYRYAYPKSVDWKETSLNPKASELSKNDKVKARYKELQEETAQTHGITVDSLILELEEARTAALEAETVQSSAAVSATMSKAKLVGLDITRVENKIIIEDDSGLNW